MSKIFASDCVLLHADGLPGCIFHRNGTTAEAVSSIGVPIEVSLSCPDPERSVLPTVLFVNCLCADFDTHPPHVVCAVEDLLLIRVLVGPPPKYISPADYDYFIFRAPGSSRAPSLELLSRPHPTFHDDDVGLLRREDGHFIIAALIATDSADVYDLHRFNSEAGTWSQVKVKLASPHDPFPCKIPRTMLRLFCHFTSTVVTIGGEAGTMGWVDLWHGILLCDVLNPNPTLRGVPLPLPMELLAQNNGLGTDIGCPKSLRGISFVPQSGSQGGCLRFVHLEATTTMVPPASSTVSDSDDEILDLMGFDWEMHDWAITTWSNYKMTTSLDDWNMDCRKTKASDTSIVSSKLKSKMLKSGLLSAGGTESGEPKTGLQNLYVSHPAPGMDNCVVYLQARVKFLDAKTFVLALDTNNNQLLAAAEFATETSSRTGIKHLPSNISKYIDRQDRVSRIPEDYDGSWEESSVYEGTESLVLPNFGELLVSYLYKGGAPTFNERQPEDKGGAPTFNERQPEDKGGAPTFNERQPEDKGGAPTFNERQPEDFFD